MGGVFFFDSAKGCSFFCRKAAAINVEATQQKQQGPDARWWFAAGRWILLRACPVLQAARLVNIMRITKAPHHPWISAKQKTVR
jgi:hypothetical protein